jgi:hypothetical protein
MLPVVTATVGWEDPPKNTEIPTETAIAIKTAVPKSRPSSITVLYFGFKGNISHVEGSFKKFLGVSLDHYFPLPHSFDKCNNFQEYYREDINIIWGGFMSSAQNKKKKYT